MFDWFLEHTPEFAVGGLFIVLLGMLISVAVIATQKGEAMDERCKPQYEARKLDYECAKYLAKQGNSTYLVPMFIPMGR